jgi:hypothetical protein
VARAREDHSDHGLQNQILLCNTRLFLIVQEIPYFIQVYCMDKIPSDYLKCFSYWCVPEMVMNQGDTGIKGNKKKNSW